MNSLFWKKKQVTKSVPKLLFVYDELSHCSLTKYLAFLKYNRAVKDRKPHIGFLMVLLQRIVTSSSHAIRCTLERRLQVLENLHESNRSLNNEELEDFTDLDGQMQLDLLVEVDESGRTSEMHQVREQCAVYGISEEPDLSAAEKLRSHPLPHWVERMTTHYLQTKECKIEKDLLGWSFSWPDGEKVQNAVFQSKDLSLDGNLLSLENPRIRGLAINLPQFIPGQPLPCVSINRLPKTVSGLWGLFEIRMSVQQSANSQIRIPLIRRSYICVFMSKEGKLFMPTARHIWDQLLTDDLTIESMRDSNKSIAAGESLLPAAEQAGQEIFDTMQDAHFAAIAREEERGMIAFASRRKAIDRLGLPEVRQFRVARLDEDETQWRSELESARQIIPEMRPLLMLNIGNGGFCD